MESALIISSTDTGLDYLKSSLKDVSCTKAAIVKTGGSARRILLEREFDLYIINGPLSDETGEELSQYIAKKTHGQIILIINHQQFESVSVSVEDFGVITVAKPLNRQIFRSAMKVANAASRRINMLHVENKKLVKKIEDIRVIDRAKCILISHLNMGEPQAHKYIEKQAMDMRVSKKSIAENILRTYEY